MHKKKRRGANSTRTHERHREAPLREARQAAPDWARASAALSSFNESSRFSRGPSRCDAKYGLFVTSSQCCHWQRYEVYRHSPSTARALRRAKNGAIACIAIRKMTQIRTTAATWRTKPPFSHPVRVAEASRGGSRVRSGQGRTRGREGCGVGGASVCVPRSRSSSRSACRR
jgi:hypothetical protein